MIIKKENYRITLFLESSLKEGNQNTRSHLPRIILFALQGTKLQTIYMNALYIKRDKHFYRKI